MTNSDILLRRSPDMVRRFAGNSVTQLSDYEIDVVVCTSTSDALDDDIWSIEGMDLARYLLHPIVLWDHDMAQPIARATNLKKTGTAITARVTFPPEGTSAKADEIRKMVKAGIITGVSAGILPTDAEPIDPRNPRGGSRITQSILLEFSIVAVPADAGAGVTARSKGAKTVPEWKVGAARNLPIEAGDEPWDGPAAEQEIFDYAGGDDFDSEKARKAFLVYDAEKPTERGSYKLPIARIADGKLVVPKAALRAAASRLSEVQIPDDVRAAAGEVLDAYEKKADIGTDRAAPRTTRRKAARRKITLIDQRGLYQVAQMCWLFEELGYQVDMAKFESAAEGDASKVPGMLAAILHDLGDALLAMTAEEVGEALAGHDFEPDPDAADDMDDAERSYVAAGKTALSRTFRAGLIAAKTRAGKKLSAETVRCLRAAMETTDQAIDLHRRALALHRQAMTTIDDLIDGNADDAADDANAEPQTDPDAPDEQAAERGRRARAALAKARAMELTSADAA